MKRIGAILKILVVTMPVLVCLIVYLYQISHRDDWKKRTTPLPKETRDLLCYRFDLPSEDSLCNDNEDVYGLDFFDIIRDTFRPYKEYEIESNKSATYDDVEKKIGTFKYECEPVVYQADGFAYFRCFYDLRGDRQFIIAIVYTYPDEAVWRMNSTSRYGD